MTLSREQMAKRVAQELRNVHYVNLGVGIPTLVSNYISKDTDLFFQSENGMLGFGHFPFEGEEDPDLINAGKQTVTEKIGCSYFSSADSFAMIRGGAVDISILGAMQVSEVGDIANWMVPGKVVKGMGGAMDLVTGAKKTIVMMEHTSKDKAPKILTRCTFPLTGIGVVNLIFTDLAVIEVTQTGLLLKEIAPGISIDEIQKVTQPKLIIDENLSEIKI